MSFTKYIYYDSDDKLFILLGHDTRCKSATVHEALPFPYHPFYIKPLSVQKSIYNLTDKNLPS
jgi:hypothetical protein